MALASISSVTGRGVHVAGDDIDTDRIIPARFMKCVTFDGLGEYFFYDVRKDADGNDRKHNLNDPRFKGASVLLSGNNFGCGSSREHAPQALQKAGFRAVIAEGSPKSFLAIPSSWAYLVSRPPRLTSAALSMLLRQIQHWKSLWTWSAAKCASAINPSRVAFAQAHAKLYSLVNGIHSLNCWPTMMLSIAD